MGGRGRGGVDLQETMAASFVRLVRLPSPDLTDVLHRPYQRASSGTAIILAFSGPGAHLSGVFAPPGLEAARDDRGSGADRAGGAHLSTQRGLGQRSGAVAGQRRQVSEEAP